MTSTPVFLPAVSVLSSLVVGGVFLVTGSLKALAPSALLAHLDRLELLPTRFLPVVVGLGAVGECVLGVALITRVFPQVIFPGTIVLLAGFAALTYWSRSARGIDDCGCYGKMVDLSPRQSLILNAIYAGLVGVAWLLPVPFGFTSEVQVAILAAAAACCGTATAVASWSFAKFGQDLLDLSPLRVKRPWNPVWLAGYADHNLQGSQLIVLMSPTCHACKAWVRPLNRISRRPDMPPLIAGMSASPEEIEGMVHAYGMAFPLLPVRPSVMSRLADGYPTVVLVENGMVQYKQVGKLPLELVERLRHTPPAGPALPANRGVPAAPHQA